MNLYLDNIVYSLQSVGGISVYWYELSQRFLQSHHNICFIEEKKTNNIFRQQLFIPHEKLLIKNGLPVVIARYLPVNFPHTLQDSIFHSSYYRVPTDKRMLSIVTVHDFTYEKKKAGTKKWIHQAQKRAALEAASGIICISQSTRRDMLELYPHLAKKKITVIYNGVSDSFYPIDKQNVISYEAKSFLQELANTEYVIFVGSRESYKNFLFAVDVINSMKNYVLVMVGGGVVSDTEITLLQNKLGKRWKHFFGISNNELNILYNYAQFLFYPSSYEGFGIPVIEAEKAGCPVIALQASSIPEIAGNKNLLISTLSEDECKQKIKEIDQDYDNIIATGISNSNRFSWNTCYSEVTEFYNCVLH